jgi:hypothetical protein
MSSAPIVLTPEDVADRTRAVWEVWNTLDPDKIVDLYTGGHGFGYRTRAARPPYERKEDYRKGLIHWLDSIETYTIAIDELHTSAQGNIGIAWGYYREEFKEKGQEPVVMLGRFSEVIRRDADGWKTILYHRDMTPFDEQDRYVPPNAG